MKKYIFSFPRIGDLIFFQIARQNPGTQNFDPERAVTDVLQRH
jgi:hypothetical protein